MDEIERQTEGMSERELLTTWHNPAERRLYERGRDHAREQGDTRGEEVMVAHLEEMPKVSPLLALAANRRLVETLTGQRWFEMQAAREADSSWKQIGAALGMSRQAAWEWYQRKITDQERYASDFHDAARARAALTDDEN